ncbi:hypothetical protein B0J13DRAFT_546621 [Dactylonectria estremocensis]|uniref:Uncharacterized protein n=1 Tax=Dactylonectria estremocensis TaxID=1079267 RepID=A0A9P9J9P8_9HYPO|nr:hypothetical protein B0J13DRAFT_546621 [Dactylonectria estremocensis]
MSTTVSSSAAASATAGGSCGATLYDIPIKDAACALSYSKNHTSILAACCGDANVVSYYNGCGLYCLAIDQTIAELTECLYDEGAASPDVFCNGNTTDTATATADGRLAATASASVVVTAGSSSSTGSSDDDDNDNDSSSTSGSDATSTDKSSATNSDNAAPGFHPQSSVSTLGLAISALLFSATAIGAFQL